MSPKSCLVCTVREHSSPTTRAFKDTGSKAGSSACGARGSFAVLGLDAWAEEAGEFTDVGSEVAGFFLKNITRPAQCL
jgi:hypothetical protein